MKIHIDTESEKGANLFWCGKEWTKMPVLSEQEMIKCYRNAMSMLPAGINTITELKDYNSEDKIRIFCTQLDHHYRPYEGSPKCLPEREKKRILNEWIDFLRKNTKALKMLHFCSRVPQALFDAACCQENLEAVHFKWGTYQDLSGLERLSKLKFLYIGSGAGVCNISSISKAKALVGLSLENFKRIEDYSLLTSLPNIAMLDIFSNLFGRIAVKDLDFLLNMPNLLSFAVSGATIRKKYTDEDLADIFDALPNLQSMQVNRKHLGRNIFE